MYTPQYWAKCNNWNNQMLPKVPASQHSSSSNNLLYNQSSLTPPGEELLTQIRLYGESQAVVVAATELTCGPQVNLCTQIKQCFCAPPIRFQTKGQYSVDNFSELNAPMLICITPALPDIQMANAPATFPIPRTAFFAINLLSQWTVLSSVPRTPCVAEPH